MTAIIVRRKITSADGLYTDSKAWSEELLEVKASGNIVTRTGWFAIGDYNLPSGRKMSTTWEPVEAAVLRPWCELNQGDRVRGMRGAKFCYEQAEGVFVGFNGLGYPMVRLDDGTTATFSDGGRGEGQFATVLL